MHLNRRQVSLAAFASGVAPAMIGMSQPLESADFNAIWKQTVSELLTQDLWTDRDGYDTTHHLMVPMHHAFLSGDLDRQREFEYFFARFCNAMEDGAFKIEGELNRAQFLAFPCRYLRLAHANRSLTEVDQVLAQLLVREHEILFADTSTPHYSHDDFPSVQAMLEWKLTDPITPRHFEKAIFDLERFCVSMAADLFAARDAISISEITQAGRDLGLRVLRERGVFTDAGEWHIEFGEAWDHPDYAYAGHDEPFEGMEPKPVPGIAEDTSHAHRWPYVLSSFRDPLDPEITDEIDGMIDGLAKQLMNHVLVPPTDEFSGYRTTNFLDGRNGIYRWGYATQGEGNGYLEYELSGTFLLGWWSLLGSTELIDAYFEMAEVFPLSQDEIDLYVGPNTTRERNPSYTLPDALENGMHQLCVMCAAKMPV